MSRCFPYPPPGHEKKESVLASSGHVNLLAKQKHKLKRHKKKDKEKRRDKHQRKDRHKEKKDRKGKHKNNDKHEEKVGNRTSKERDVNQILFRNEGVYDGKCKAREIEYRKHSDELDRQIKDEQEIVATRMIDNSPTKESPTRVNYQSRRAGKFPISIQRFSEVIGSANVAHENQSSYSELLGNAIKDQPVVPCMVQQRSDGLYTATTVKSKKIERSTSTAIPSNKLQKPGNGIKEPLRDQSMVVQQRSDDPCRKTFAEKKILDHSNVTVNPGSQVPKLFGYDGKEQQSDHFLMKKTTENSKVAVNGRNKVQNSFGNDVKEPLVREAMVIQQTSDCPIDMAIPKLEPNDVPVKSSIKVQQSFNFVDPSVSNFPSLPQRTVDVACSMKAIGDRVDVKKFAPNDMIIDQKKAVGVNPLVDKDSSEKRIEAKEKKKVGYAYNEQENRGADRVQDRNKNEIDKLIEEEKKLTLVREEDKYEHIKDVDTRELGKNNGGNLELLASRMDKKGSNTTHENRKRKELGLNGFVPEFKSQSNKLRKSSSHLEESGKIENSSQSACSSMKPETINNIKSGKLPVCNKEQSVNGSKVTDRSSFDLKIPTLDDDTENQVSSRPPHPDSKYLDLIYSVPKVEYLPQEEDLSWLFNTSCDCSKPKPKAEEIPEVWDKPIRIESADVIVMPYVIPY
ncbi:uncharacterized protein LOC121984742 isoform X1 [Zingiber officinale]|uniref:Uncharacterized protein n=1 Tax=Zingiber officinale TaxID=94328 RepID=A0A8J5GMI8_ZINOF|nr:uncharacterized protein LOC121984742 isoform X1 [Zingiber officinale]XP_042393797.1 uncharacterized protein LOC121984742 isoform X1 [Zingiber officinale]XP_042393798.1 uncharacterized protein LOC121984742 isoform X1 [Zingiber officinale]KAG6503803.1 hypothetical protein ZIOFF_036127 [Zingiber officinale]